MFYPCQNQDIWLNIHCIEAITIEQISNQFEVRAYLPDNNKQHYLLEKFDNKPDAIEFIEYLLDGSDEKPKE